MKLSDGGEINLYWYPLNYNNYPTGTPIVAFLLGACGVPDDIYAKEFAIMVK